MFAKQIGKGLSVLLLLVGIACASAFAGSAVVGSVAGSMNATVSGRPVIPSAVIFSGDNLKVADGTTVIALGDGSRLMFGRDTQVSFLRDGDQVTVQLERGSVSVYHSGANSGLRIKVNDVYIEPAKGFTTMGQVAALNGALVVTSNQGALHVQGDSSSVEVPQGQTITIRQKAGRAPQAAGGSQKFAGGGSTLLEAGALAAGVAAAILAGIALSRAGDAKDAAKQAATEASTAASNAAAADSDAIVAASIANQAGCAVDNLAGPQFLGLEPPSPYVPPTGMTCNPPG
jgi:phosphohistidine swiveling domain-containing protein